MNDHYFDDYEPDAQRDRYETCCGPIVLLCAVIIGFVLFFTVYTVIWEVVFESLSIHAFELATVGVILAVIIVAYLVRNKSFEKQKMIAANV